MKLTKYQHACLVLEDQDKKLIIDPGELTPTFGQANDVAGVVITHMHADHFAPGHLNAIIDANPDVIIYTTAETAERFPKNTKIVTGGDKAQAGPFNLEFFGVLHHPIHESFPQAQNVGVLVNDGALYYPGDSYTLPADRDINTLALPVAGPWLQIGDAIDFLWDVDPTQCFSTHNGLLSEAGNATANEWIGKVSEHKGIGFIGLSPGESLNI